jgi:hypothetical protein
MDVAILHAPLDSRSTTSYVVDFMLWLRTHRGAFVLAGLLAFSYPLIGFVSTFGTAPEMTPGLVLSGVFRGVSFGLANWPMLLVTGYVFQRLSLSGWRAGVAAFVLGACAAPVNASLPYLNSWTDVLEGTGDARRMVVDTLLNTLTIAVLFYAHLQRSRVHEEAAKRLAVAQLAQREARRRLAQGRLQAVQARIDPQLLFDMLDAVRRAYESDAARAEQLLDELVAFLRAALPRLQHASSSVPREAEIARACARLHALAGTSDVGMTLDVSPELMDARFPPGVLLPLLNDALQVRAGECRLIATRHAGICQLVLMLPARPSMATVERVRTLLADLYGTSAELSADNTNGACRATVKVPYEHA